ncbi:DUF2975 domain-containing protein [soil metagenome]
MHTTRLVVGTLRILLVLAFAALVLTQVVVLPQAWAQMAGESPELAYLRWPTLAAGMLEVLCVQVVIVCTWNLLTLVERDRIFGSGSLVWVDAIVWMIAAGWGLLLITVVSVALTWGLAEVPVALLLVLLLTLVAGAVLGLLMVVMRALLRQATTLQTDMEGVI